MRDISIIHLYIYGQLKREMDKSRIGNCIHISKVYPIVKWFVRLPKRYHIEIIDELVEYKLLKRLNRDNFELLPPSNSICLQDSLGNPLW